MVRFNKIAICGLLSFAVSGALADDYPKSRMEKEMDSIGSATNYGKGIFVSAGKSKKESTKEVIGNVNKFLFQASLDTLKFAPLASADSTGGVVITEWYSPKGQENVQFKIIVYLQGKVIEPESIDVVAFERVKKNGGWSESTKSVAVANTIENKIIRKSRELYLESKK
ncbi:MAG: hypothetical protein DGJ47_000715 [Rickettsiaceae bacterium]